MNWSLSILSMTVSPPSLHILDNVTSSPRLALNQTTDLVTVATISDHSVTINDQRCAAGMSIMDVRQKIVGHGANGQTNNVAE
jgi:hypothetical protein